MRLHYMHFHWPLIEERTCKSMSLVSSQIKLLHPPASSSAICWILPWDETVLDIFLIFQLKYVLWPKLILWTLIATKKPTCVFMWNWSVLKHKEMQLAGLKIMFSFRKIKSLFAWFFRLNARALWMEIQMV